MRTKVVTNIQNESDNDALAISYKGQGGLALNETFPLPPVLPAAWLLIINDFKTKCTAAEYGNAADIIAKNVARDLVNDAFRLDGIYVNLIANGDKVKCESSKFPIYDPAKHSVLPNQEAKNLKATGDITVYSRLMPEKLIVRLIQTTQTPSVESSWKLVAATKKQSVTLHNCPVDSRTYVRIALVTESTEISFGGIFSVLVS